MSILSHHVSSYRSYTFCLGYILELIDSLDQDHLTTFALLLAISLEIQDNSDSINKMNDIIPIFELIFFWLFIVLHRKIDEFPFHHKVSNEIRHWYQGICFQSFGNNRAVECSTKRKILSVTDSDTKDSVDSERDYNKRVKLITIPLTKKKSK